MILVTSALQEEGNDGTNTGRNFNSYDFKVVSYNSYCLLNINQIELKV